MPGSDNNFVRGLQEIGLEEMQRKNVHCSGFKTRFLVRLRSLAPEKPNCIIERKPFKSTIREAIVIKKCTQNL